MVGRAEVGVVTVVVVVVGLVVEPEGEDLEVKRCDNSCPQTGVWKCVYVPSKMSHNKSAKNNRTKSQRSPITS